jgi:hypothetical protein
MLILSRPSPSYPVKIPMRVVLCALVPLFASGGLTTTAQAQAIGCPPDHQANRDLIEMFLTADHQISNRIRHGISESAIDSLHVLGGSVIGRDDQSICADLGKTYAFSFPFSDDLDPGRQVVFYRSGSFYFAVLTIRQSADRRRFRVGTSAVVIYDADLNQIGGHAF